VPIKRIYEYETAGETPPNDDCKEPEREIMLITSNDKKTLKSLFEDGWVEINRWVNPANGVTYVKIKFKCNNGTTPNTSAGATPPAPDYGTLGWFFNTPTYTNQPLVNVLPRDLRGVLGVNPSSTAFKQKMSGYIAGFLIEANNVAPKVIIKNQDAVSRQRFKLYVYLLIDELKKALLKSDDPYVRAYANNLRYPDDAQIEAAFIAFGPENGSYWDPFANPYQAANMIVNSFLDSIKIDVYREEKIDAVTVGLSEKVKNAYNALVPILNSCTEGVATGQTSYCTAQAALVMEIRNILISQNKDVSQTLLSFEGGLYAEEADIASIFAGFGGNTTYQGYTITYTPPTATTSASLNFKKGGEEIKVKGVLPGDNFDESGNFIGNFGNNTDVKIRIKEQGVFFDSEKSIPLTEYNFDTPAKAKILAKIIGFYSYKGGFDKTKLYNGDFSVGKAYLDSGAPYYRSLYNDSEPPQLTTDEPNVPIMQTIKSMKKIVIFVNKNGNVDSKLTNKYQILSILYHEIQHLTGSLSGSQEECRVYNLQINHSSFLLTPLDFQLFLIRRRNEECSK
jgi:hypothetical protein